MTSGQKVALSLLISVLVFCAFTVIAFSGLFDLLEVNFYQPVVQEIKEKKLNEIATAQSEYFDILMKRFDSFTVNPDVKTYVESRPADSVVQAREKARSQLVTATSSLSGLRIIDNNGRNIYFSTFSSDVISTEKGISYRNYDSSGEISFDSLRSKQTVAITADSDKKTRIIKDGDRNRIIFSLPFYNSRNEYTGSALFYCDAAGFSQFLFNRNLIDINGFAALVTSAQNKDKSLDGFGGFVFGFPNYGQESIRSQLLKEWQKTKKLAFFRLSSVSNENVPNEGDTLCAFSLPPARDDYGFISLLYSENELKFPQYIRILLLVTAFFTFYLAVFLILSFKHDDIVVIRDKVRRYENEFFIAYKKSSDKTSDYLVEQKPVLERRILKSLGRKGEKHAVEFKSAFESCWQELYASFVPQPAALASGQSAASVINAEELKEIVRSSLEDILENGKIQINASVEHSSRPELESEKTTESYEETAKFEEPESTEEFEKIEPAENVEELAEEEIDEIEAAEETAEVEAAEEIEEIEDVESIEESDELDSADEAELVEEAEPVDKVADVEEIGAVETMEETEDIEELDELEEAESIDDFEESESVAGVESAEEIAEVEDVEEADEIEELDEAESVEEIEPEEEAEPIGDNEELDDAEPIDDVEEIEEIEEAEPTDEIETLPEVDEREERAVEIAKTLAALPEKAPHWADNDDIELDSEGLSRKLSYSEMHDIQKLKDVAHSIDEMDTKLEVLEPFDPSAQSVNLDSYITHLLDNNVYSDDDVYKDEVLLEKIEFGVPSSDIVDDESDESVAENFVAVQPDYSSLDDDTSDEKLYEAKAPDDIKNSEHFFENPQILPSEERREPDEEKDRGEDSVSELENVEDLEEIAENQEETSEASQEESDALEVSEENMPFMFTQFASAQNAQVAELAPDLDDAIVQEEDGTFRVTDLPDNSAQISLDLNFKKLVDSILR